MPEGAIRMALLQLISAVSRMFTANCFLVFFFDLVERAKKIELDGSAKAKARAMGGGGGGGCQDKREKLCFARPTAPSPLARSFPSFFEFSEKYRGCEQSTF